VLAFTCETWKRQHTDGSAGLIKLFVGREGGRNSYLRSRHNGIGIDPGMLPHVFDVFVQQDALHDKRPPRLWERVCGQFANNAART
jgi:hypothetical protein